MSIVSQRGKTHGSCIDINGNRVGTYELILGEVAESSQEGTVEP